MTSTLTAVAYQTRTRSVKRTYHYQRTGPWSAWSTEPVSPGENRETESRKGYRFREIPAGEGYRFVRWSAWSDWENSPTLPEAEEIETETRVLYRTR